LFVDDKLVLFYGFTFLLFGGSVTVQKSNAIKVALVTNIPTPYRRPVFEILAAMPDICLKVIYCSAREPDREWDLKATDYDAEYLDEHFFTVGDKYVHANPGVFNALRRFKPDVVIGTGFNPTHLFAFLYATLFGCMFVPMTDGTFESERVLSGMHRWLRRRIYRRAKAFIAASDGGFDLYESYGVDLATIFKSHLCTNNAAFENEPETQKKFDLIYSGRFSPFKNPLFTLEVAKATALQLRRKVNLAFLGAGPLENEMRNTANLHAEWVNTDFLGFAKQSELPAIYKMARVMLFPTLADVWGVVANESLAAGVPVIASPLAGCVPELVRDGLSGYVITLEAKAWVDAVVRLLENPLLCQQMGSAGRTLVQSYTYSNAAQGIADAVRVAIGQRVVRRPENNRAL
jgi:glycosyltransferase involved in cell wall biosynthesis